MANDSVADGAAPPQQRASIPAQSFRSAIIFVCSVSGFCCPAFVPAHAACTSAPFVSLSVEQGLSHGTVHAIVQDRRGFMWFGTEDGLNKFDGSHFSAFRHDPADPNSLASSNFGKIEQDRDGILWFGTWGGGVDRYDQRSGAFFHYGHDPRDPNSLSGNRIELLHEDAQGYLWVGTENAGLNRLDRQTGRIVRYSHNPTDATSLSNNRVLVLSENPDGTFWLGTDGGLDLFDPGKGIVIDRIRNLSGDASSLSSDRIRSLVVDRNGDLWIGTRGGGVNRLDRETGKIRRYQHDPADPNSISGDSIARLFVDSNGMLWLATYSSGLNCYKHDSDSFEIVPSRLIDRDGLSGDRVESFWEDRSRVLWIGTRGGGLNKLDLKPRKFTNYEYHPDEPDGLPHPNVRAIAELPDTTDSRLFIGTDGGGLAVFDRAGGVFRHYRRTATEPGTLSSNRILSIAGVSDGSMWVGTYDGGLNYGVPTANGYRFESLRHNRKDAASLSNDRVQVLLPDGDYLWAGTANGLNRLQRLATGETQIQRFYRDASDEHSLPGNYVIALRKSREGLIWIGTTSGLAVYDPATGRFRRYQHDPADPTTLSSNIVQAIHIDDNVPGILWVGTEDGGLNRVETATGRFTAVLQRDGLPSNVVQGVLQDNNGMLWVSTGGGLSRFDQATGKFRNYDIADGLLSHSFVRNSAFRSRSGEFFFGSVAGLAAFNPTQVRDNPHVPPVVLTSFRRFNEAVELGRPLTELSELTLTHKDNFFSFEFAALDYTNPAMNRYAYRLYGVDDDWVDAGTRNLANYTEVMPGKYVFRVKGSNNDGIWNETGTSIQLTITAAFWQTLWFRGAVLASLLVLGAAAYFWRTQAFRRGNQRLREINARLANEVAERERAEAEREGFVRELENKNAELERFTYTVSHDLKTPLVTIEGFLGLLEMDMSESNSGSMHDDLAHIRQATGNMQRLLDDLLELSRAGVLVGPSTDVPLTEVAREAAALVAGRVGARQTRIEIAADMPVVRADRVRAIEIFQNLIENALKFMGEQPLPTIEIGVTETEHGTACYVRDNGIGIERDYQEKIFGLFERLGSDSDGTGIGLALVRRLVEVYKGRIWVESAGSGKGSCFYFTLPEANE